MIAVLQRDPESRLRGASSSRQIVLEDIAWRDYQTIGDILRDRPALRLTFDRGSLEIMTTSPEHEKYKMRLGRLVETMAEELQLRIEPGGNMTFQREDADKGLEAGQCYWVQHEEQVRGKLEWDSSKDPPPDLVIEIEVSRSALGRMNIYATLGVPEVWCFDGEAMRTYLLGPAGTYTQSATSSAFKDFEVAQLLPYLQFTGGQDYLTLIRSFREWLKNWIGNRT